MGHLPEYKTHCSITESYAAKQQRVRECHPATSRQGKGAGIHSGKPSHQTRDTRFLRRLFRIKHPTNCRRQNNLNHVYARIQAPLIEPPMIIWKWPPCCSAVKGGGCWGRRSADHAFPVASGYGPLYFVKILGNRRDLLRSATKDKYKNERTNYESSVEWIVIVYLFYNLHPFIYSSHARCFRW